MRRLLSKLIELGRIGGIKNDGPHGAFRVTHPQTGRTLQVIVSDGRDWNDELLPLPTWEHASVSASFGVPTYAEMHWIKQQFWEPSECVVEFHVPESDHINCHPNVLHLWRVLGNAFPVPPKECV